MNMKRLTTVMVITMTTLAPAYAQQPALTDIDQMRIEIVNLKFALAAKDKEWSVCIAEKGPLQDQANQRFLQQEVKTMVSAIEAAHPGFTFDPQSGQFAKKDDTKDGEKKQ